MMVLLIIIVVVFIMLLVATAAHAEVPTMSLFEVKRRAETGHAGSRQELARRETAGAVDSVWRAIEALLLVAVVVLVLIAFGWAWGIISAIVIALAYRQVAHAKFITRQSQRLYKATETAMATFVKKVPIVWLIGSASPYGAQPPQRLDSIEELQQLIETSQGILTHDQKRRLSHGLAFDTKLVESIMTPRSVIESVKATEMLGPLVLDELHKKGHSRLPVVLDDLDHVIGVLQLNNLLSLDTTRRSVTAKEAMEPKVYYIRHDDSLGHALAAFLRLHHHLFIVINQERETVGLVTLEDVIEALLGQRIVDEDDVHEDLRAVAEQNPHHNNLPPHHQDL